MPNYTQLIANAAISRTRFSWNDRLFHWERPASDHEEGKIERAARATRAIIADSRVLLAEDVTIEPQGSYFNNTNVRLEADIDLRVQVPLIYVVYDREVDRPKADNEFGYANTGRSLRETVDCVRNELARICTAEYGKYNVEVGTKAVTVSGLAGQVDVDLVPAMHYHRIFATNDGVLHRNRGVAIIGTDGSITLNFPTQHHENGKTKRTLTRHKFKKVVRMLKRLNGELAEMNLIEKCLPSFFVECLVYSVEDTYFLFADDRYMRLARVLARLDVLLHDDNWVSEATEVNEIKYLFHNSQPWTLDQAKSFVAAAVSRLGA